jgi:hypothetical protein
MKAVWFIFVCLAFVGCSKDHSVTQSGTWHVVEEQHDNTSLQIEWIKRMTELELTYTTRTYQCITEMYSLAYRPVNSGPVCRESCKLLKQINVTAAEAPTYINNPQQYAQGESKVCNEAPKRKHSGS